MADESTTSPDPIEVHCWICNAQPGQRCTSIIDARKYREPHAQRVADARKGPDA